MNEKKEEKKLPRREERKVRKKRTPPGRKERKRTFQCPYPVQRVFSRSCGLKPGLCVGCFYTTFSLLCQVFSWIKRQVQRVLQVRRGVLVLRWGEKAWKWRRPVWAGRSQGRISYWASLRSTRSTPISLRSSFSCREARMSSLLHWPQMTPWATFAVQALWASSLVENGPSLCLQVLYCVWTT